ncbi:ribosome-recycling factor [Streptomyces sp. SH5]|uniref:Ribosome-recycling factor n=1 Tax=Streptomyces sindenensis TaxID=67363 RepID=A0ABW6ED19_9ACTN|nr:ribosome-recycling factor [Streptomyces sp. SH5]WGP13097.1 ribosome-recycling factor [Streptomyces sp. SH5]
MPTLEDAKKDFAAKLETISGALRSDLQKISDGRARPGLLEGLGVETGGTSTPLGQLASITLAGTTALWVKPWDPSHADAIHQVIRSAQFNPTPEGGGGSVRVPVPPLTSDQRKQAQKEASGRGEEAHVQVRTALREALEAASGEEATELRSLAEQCTEQINKIVADKEKTLYH